MKRLVAVLVLSVMGCGHPEPAPSPAPHVSAPASPPPSAPPPPDPTALPSATREDLPHLTATVSLAVRGTSYVVQVRGAPPSVVPLGSPIDDRGPHVPALREAFLGARRMGGDVWRIAAPRTTSWRTIELADLSALMAGFRTREYELNGRYGGVALGVPAPVRDRPRYDDEPTCAERGRGARLRPRTDEETAAGGAPPRVAAFELDARRTVHARLENCPLTPDCTRWAESTEHAAPARDGEIDLGAIRACLDAVHRTWSTVREMGVVAHGSLTYGEVVAVIELVSTRMSPNAAMLRDTTPAGGPGALDVRGPHGESTLVIEAPPSE